MIDAARFRAGDVATPLRSDNDLATLQHRLSVAEERLSDITRLASDWIWETDTNLAVTFVSARVAEVLDYQPIEIIGRNFLELGAFAGAPPLDPSCRVPFRDRSFVMSHRDGSLRRFQVSALPVFCQLSGDFLGFRGMARDVTAQFDAAHRAAESQQQLTQALESISEGFALFDPNDRLVLCNRKFREVYPHATQSIVPGMTYEAFARASLAGGDIPVDEGGEEAWMAERLRLRAGGSVSLELRLADGRWIKISDHPTADGSIVGIRTDITALKNREEALCLAKESAEIASRSKSDFLANISHELRTPLNAIIGFSEIMRGEIFGPLGSAQYREYVGDVLDSAHHLLSVINDILDVAKAESGTLDLVEEEVEIPALVRSAIRLIQERAHRGGIVVTCGLPEDLPHFRVDERKLKQVLLNLLTNAVKFTPPQGKIEIASSFTPAGDLLLSVIDTGIGIAAQDVATALAPFGQVDSKLSRRYEGTGLGLPLSNAMMRLHGGDLTIESVVGQGTTVLLRLPAGRRVPC